MKTLLGIITGTFAGVFVGVAAVMAALSEPSETREYLIKASEELFN